jgi:hypothetical protein
MVWNNKIAFRIFLAILLILFVLILYFVFFGSDNAGIEKVLETVGFKSSESGGGNTPGTPLPSNPSSSGSSSGGSGGSSGSSGSSESGSGQQVLRFCTFNAYHIITSEVPCRCGFSGVCSSTGSTCDATFNNGEGVCS